MMKHAKMYDTIKAQNNLQDLKVEQLKTIMQTFGESILECETHIEALKA